jgi:hypothetical protein
MADETAALLEELGAVLGPAGLLSGGDIPERSLTDWMGGPPAAPLAVIRPADAEQVSAALRICHAHAVPVTPQGGMTGLCGGARPADGGVALSLERMTAIERIDPDGMTMTVQAGATLQAVQQAAEAAGLYFALDLGARGGCTIGGNLATNAGGNRVIRYGMTRDLTLGLEAVLPDGTRVDMLNTMVKNNAGYDLKQLFIGAEGTLGVITRAVLRLHPKPACQAVALCVVDSYEAVLRVLGAARARLGPLLSAFGALRPRRWRARRQRPLAPLEHGRPDRGHAAPATACISTAITTWWSRPRLDHRSLRRRGAGRARLGSRTCDMKGGIAASVIAAEAFLDTHPDFAGAIEISATADEESGGYGGVAYLAEKGWFRPLPRAARHHPGTAEQGPHLPRPSRRLVGRDRDEGPDRPWLHALPRRLRRAPHGRRAGRDGGHAVPAAWPASAPRCPWSPKAARSSTLNINAIHGGSRSRTPATPACPRLACPTAAASQSTAVS